jgi:hypothetical protein
MPQTFVVTDGQSQYPVDLATQDELFYPVWEGVAGFHYSHSYGVYLTSPPNVSPGGLYSDRVKQRLGMASMTKRSTSGNWMLDIAGSAIGSGFSWTPGTHGLVIIDGVENDMSNNGLDAQGLTGFNNALRVLLWNLVSATRLNETDAAFTETSGTWTASSSQNQYIGTTVRNSVSAGAQFTFAFTGTDVILVLGGKDNSAGGAAGGTAEVKVDGVVVTTVSLGNAYRTTTPNGFGYTSGPVAVPLLGMGAGAHTITVTNTGASGTVLYRDGYMTIGTQPPTIIVMKQPYNDTYVSSGSDAAVDAYNQAIDQVVAEPGLSSKPIIVVDPQPGFDKNTMFDSPTHLNDRGSVQYASKIVAAVAGLTWREGLNYLNG